MKVTTAAQQATYQGAAISNSTTITSANNSLIIRVNSAEKTVTLDDGTYTPSQLAAHLESKLTSAFGTQVARVTSSGASLQLRTLDYGRNAAIKVATSSAQATLGFSDTNNHVGVDVAGQFVVMNGNVVVKTEAATGTGQRLQGQSIAQENAPENADHVRSITADLAVRVSLQPADIPVGGATSVVTLTQGLGFRLQRTIADALSSTVDSTKTRYQEKIDSIDKSLQRVSDVFESRKQYLQRQFSALERSVSGFNSVSQLLTGQLSGLSFGK